MEPSRIAEHESDFLKFLTCSVRKIFIKKSLRPWASLRFFRLAKKRLLFNLIHFLKPPRRAEHESDLGYTRAGVNGVDISRVTKRYSYMRTIRLLYMFLELKIGEQTMNIQVVLEF